MTSSHHKEVRPHWRPSSSVACRGSSSAGSQRSHPKGQIDVIDDLKHQGAQEEHEAGSFCLREALFYGAGPGDNKRERLKPSGRNRDAQL